MDNPYLSDDTAKISSQSEIMRRSFRGAAAENVAAEVFEQLCARSPDATDEEKMQFWLLSAGALLGIDADLKKLEQPDAPGSAPDVF